MKSIVRVVEPPLTVLVDEFSLAFEEVGVVLGFPPHPVSIVSEGAVVWIPIGDDSTVASEGTQVQHGDGANGVEARRVHRFVEAGVNARFRSRIGEPTDGVGVV